MRIVEKEARKKVVWLEKKSDWDYRSVTQMWDAIKDDFVRSTEKLKGRQRLNVFLSMQTCCRQMHLGGKEHEGMWQRLGRMYLIYY